LVVERRHDRLVRRLGDRKISVVLDQHAVGRGTPVGEFVIGGINWLLTRELGTDIGDDHAVPVVRHFGGDPPIRIDDHATAGIIDRSLVAGLGRRH